MKIAIFTDTFLPKIDGISISTRTFCLELGKRGHEFLILCPKYGEGDFNVLESHTKIVRLKNFPLPSYPDVKVVLPQKKKIMQAIQEFNPDLIHIQTPGLIAKYSLKIAKKLNIPLVGTYHTLMTEMAEYVSLYRLLKMDKVKNLFKKKNKPQKIQKKLEAISKQKKKKLTKKFIAKVTNRVYKKCRTIITPTDIIRQDLIKQGIKNDIQVISNGIDLNLYHGQPRKLNTQQPKIIHAGRISHEKNVSIVLKAFRLILNQIPQASFAIMGDGPALKSIQKEIDDLGLKEKIKTPGFLPHTELVKEYKNFDIFITASTMETQGLVVLEAMASGLPCVGVDAFALPELIKPGHNGAIAPPFDQKKIAELAIGILSDETTYSQLSQNALTTARGHDLPLSVDMLEQVYIQAVREESISENKKKP